MTIARDPIVISKQWLFNTKPKKTRLIGHGMAASVVINSIEGKHVQYELVRDGCDANSLVWIMCCISHYAW